MRKFKRMIVCVMTAVMTISCMPGVSALAGRANHNGRRASCRK